MDPQTLLKLARRWTPLVLVVAALAGGAAYALSKIATKMYRADGLVLVSQAPRTGGNAFDLTSNQVNGTYATLMTQDALLGNVIDELHLNQTVDQLSHRVGVSPQRDTELIDVAVTDPDPKRAAAIANQLMTDFVARISADNQARIDKAGAALTTQITDLQSTIAQEQHDQTTAQAAKQDSSVLQSQIQSNGALLTQLINDYSTFRAQQAQTLDAVSVAARAPVPTAPDSPKTALNTALGAIAGLMLGIGLAALLQFLDQDLRTEEDVAEKLGLTTIAVVPRYNPAWSGGRRGRRRLTSRQTITAGEAYRRLRTNLLFSALDTPLASVVLTSARAGEGKTITAANLAGIVAAAGQRVLLVDADMRRPRQHQIFDQPLRDGTSELLLKSRERPSMALDGAHVTHLPNLSLLTAGTVPPNPSELLASKHVTGLLRHLEMQYDLVVIDTPPANAVTDAQLLASKASATVLVIEAGRTSARQARATIEALRTVGGNVVGVVLNKARRSATGGYYYHYYEAPESSKARAAASATGEPEPLEAWSPICEPVGGHDRAASRSLSA